MNIESIDLFYFALPQIKDIADGSQDSFVVRVRSDTGLEGFGESAGTAACAVNQVEGQVVQCLERLFVLYGKTQT